MTTWFLIFISTICLEGLGRRYVPQIPSVAFYFLKDLVLLLGYLRFPPPASVRRVTKYLYRGFGVFWVASFGWTVIEVFNPAQESFVLGLIGLRAYWLWWIAPMLIAGVLQNATQKRRAIYILIAMASGVAVLAAFQFASPPDSSLNLYSVVNGEEIYADMATVQATGRARVASTFSFISGFSDFAVLVPPLLLSLGLETQDRRLRRLALAATALTAAVVPMSGSRLPILLGIAVLAITAWTAGLFFTRVGRRVIVGGAIAGVVAVVAFPDAFVGVQSRFADTEETNTRLGGAAMMLPPAALTMFDYPAMGIGTGMQQNSRAVFHIDSRFSTEPEVGRYLVELGPVGYLLVWTAKLGLMVALLRSYSILKRAGRRGAAGAALSYALLTMNGNLTFDHIWQALYFTGCGFIIAEVVSALKLNARAALTDASSATASLDSGKYAPAQE